MTYSVPERPICFPTDECSRATLDWFIAVCRVVGGIRKARYGQVGARPDAFWTCRYNEKALQRLGATVVSSTSPRSWAASSAMKTDAAVQPRGRRT